MDVNQPLALLGGLSPAQFMRTHWQKKPLLVRGALPGFKPLLTRAALFALAARDDVESRMLVRAGDHWSLEHGPFARRALPRLKDPDWTLLVQGVDLHDDRAHELIERFRFVPDARLDDLMISYASTGGGVGPHFDSYDVFLLQAQGRRRWRIGRQDDLSLVAGLPLKILAHFEPEEEWVLEPGDMLYLPPRWAHDGVALGHCMTYSVGFRAPGERGLGTELLFRLASARDSALADALYADASQPATGAPGHIPDALFDFARRAVQQALADPARIDIALGEWLSEPKPTVWFERTDDADLDAALRHGVTADRRTRMLYAAEGFFINGEQVAASARNLPTWRALADQRRISAAACEQLDAAGRALLLDWLQSGWLHAAGA